MFNLFIPLAILATIGFIFRLDEKSKYLLYLLCFFQILPFFALLYLFISNDTSYQYVWTYGGEYLPLKYRISAVWAAREGPLLLWVVFLSTMAIYLKDTNGLGSKKNLRIRFTIIQGFILTILCIAQILNPFKVAVENLPSTFSQGLHPLLQTNLMIIHPPMVFLFYTFCIILAAAAISKLIGEEEDISSISNELHKIARPALLIGAVGIGLGGLWAYIVLDWGGYWAWDPVETGSILPWLAILILLHLRLQPKKDNKHWWILAGISPAFFSLVAAIVTRASGVWASSVHTFVTDANATPPPDVWSRLMILKSDSGTGEEIMSYLIFAILLVTTWAASLISIKMDNQYQNDFKKYMRYYLFLVPIFCLISALGAINIWSFLPNFMIVLISFMPLMFVFYLYKEPLLELIKKSKTRIYMIGAFTFLGVLSNSFIRAKIGLENSTILEGDPIITGLGFLLLTLLIMQKDMVKSYGYQLSGTLLYLFSAWSTLCNVYHSAIAMLIFLSPWLLSKEIDDGNNKIMFGDKKLQLKILHISPVVLVSSYLLLSWLILLNSIDDTQLALHEILGAPILLLIISCLMIYGWIGKVPSDIIPIIFSSIIIISIVLSWLFYEQLPGDSDKLLLGPFTRGHLAWMIMPMLLLAIPSIISVIHKNSNIISKKKKKSRHIRKIAAHVTHLGILILLLGHIFATVLVERGGPEHQITLAKDVPQEFDEFEFTYREIKTMEKGDESFEEKFDVGDAYLGATIDVHKNGDFIQTIEPGMLRFDQGLNSFPRSEVERVSFIKGDLIVVFDFSQAQSLQSQMSNLENIESVRITAYNLHGSNLVWLGWGLIILGLSANLIEKNIKNKFISIEEE